MTNPQPQLQPQPQQQAFRIEICPQAWAFGCLSDQTLLMAALAGGFKLPHACRNGTCRACIARLIEGEVHCLIEWPGLSREEKDEGWILPCVACPRSDLQLDLGASAQPRSDS